MIVAACLMFSSSSFCWLIFCLLLRYLLLPLRRLGALHSIHLQFIWSFDGLVLRHSTPRLKSQVTHAAVCMTVRREWAAYRLPTFLSLSVANPSTASLQQRTKSSLHHHGLRHGRPTGHQGTQREHLSRIPPPFTAHQVSHDARSQHIL
jgi:hypothetical protein